jgi:hypothetical protein
VDRLEDDDDSLDPNETGGLWEHQTGPLTVGELRSALADLPANLVVEEEQYNGEGGLTKLAPMHIDLRGFNRVPEAVVILTSETSESGSETRLDYD